MEQTVIYIVRNDFRLHDNPALFEALKQKHTIIAYIYEEDEKTEWAMGAAKKWWLHYALTDLCKQLQKLNHKLIIRKGVFEEELYQLINETKANAVYWNRVYDPNIYTRDIELGIRLTNEGFTVKTFEGTLLLPPWTVKTKTKEPYKVFTPFYRAFLKETIPDPLPKIDQKNEENQIEVFSLTIEDLSLLPSIPWTNGFEARWKPTEEAAIQVMYDFIDNKLNRYMEKRDFPIEQNTSQLSAYLAFGQLSVRRLFAELQNDMDIHEHMQGEPYIRQLIWREFSYHLLLHFPNTISEPLNQKFASFQWDHNMENFSAWCKGQTGYPIVDAGMRELWETGFMHNRVRMIVASFLTKHLLIPWQEGAEWFWDTLLDADLANNTMGWQWVAGSGADAAPYFRIFNPTLQGEKFDPEGNYIKKWVPELKRLSNKYIHEPWKAPNSELIYAGVELGRNYPLPIVDHQAARKRALERYEKIK